MGRVTRRRWRRCESSDTETGHRGISSRGSSISIGDRHCGSLPFVSLTTRTPDESLAHFRGPKQRRASPGYFPLPSEGPDVAPLVVKTDELSLY